MVIGVDFLEADHIRAARLKDGTDRLAASRQA
jgi:hypothetical protein